MRAKVTFLRDVSLTVTDWAGDEYDADYDEGTDFDGDVQRDPFDPGMLQLQTEHGSRMSIPLADVKVEPPLA